MTERGQMITKLKGIERRGAFCITIGLYYIVTGLASLSTPAAVEELSKKYGYQVLLSVFPLAVWSWLFVALGVVAIVCSLTRKYWLAFGLLQGQAAWWGLLFITNFFVTGYKNSLVLASSYIVYCILLAIISGWKENQSNSCDLIHWKSPPASPSP